MEWIVAIPLFAFGAMVVIGNWHCMLRGGSMIPLFSSCLLFAALFVPRLWRICVIGVALDPATWMLIACGVIYGIAPGIQWLVARARGSVPEPLP